ncbi:MAG: hypothetical protein HYX40_03955 [Sphingobacteriales bacterium]|nr:hypothetical protein [Sphingobacteriales bacterium]
MPLPLKQNHLVLFLTLFFFSCASKYRPVNPSQLVYGTQAEKSEVELYYRYDVMAGANNIKQTNKELKNDIKVIAVKIHNNTPRQITIGENAKFYGDGKELTLLSTDLIKRQLHQATPFYLGYLLLSPIKFSFDKDNGAKTVDVFGGAVIGGALAAGNIYVATKANKKLKKELDDNNIIGKNILPGETVYGLIALQKTGYVPLILKLVK